MSKSQNTSKSNNQEQQNDHQNILSPMNSFNLKQELNTASIQHGRQKLDMATQTDQVICKCDCDQIAKLKQKAHKSFMQVIQIQNLYKEEIEQIQQQHEERQKTQLKKFQCKEALLTQKCRELEQELQKNREYLEKEKEERICKYKLTENHMLQVSIESPFVVDHIEQIYPIILDTQMPLNPDDSTDTIRHLKEFIPSQNLQQQHRILQENLWAFIQQFKSSLKSPGKNPQITKMFNKVENSIEEVMNLLKLLIENAVTSQQKYNIVFKSNTQIQARYKKLLVAFEAGQKQSKFMAEHIRRISQDKINIDKKYHQIDKTNKYLQETLHTLKQNLLERGIKIDDNRDPEIVTNVKIQNSDDDINIQLNQILMKKNRLKQQKVRSSEGKMSNFRKKPIFLQKRE